ncbi:hypothetical protein NC652_005135 [Populus alba x Populus x berolinensis]|nr:hypothetical protein NC652_005135 [Populus alba x Populus x berolinensis]
MRVCFVGRGGERLHYRNVRWFVGDWCGPCGGGSDGCSLFPLSYRLSGEGLDFKTVFVSSSPNAYGLIFCSLSVVVRSCQSSCSKERADLRPVLCKGWNGAKGRKRTRSTLQGHPLYSLHCSGRTPYNNMLLAPVGRGARAEEWDSDNDKEAAERRELAERKGGEYATRGCTQENVVAYGEEFMRCVVGFDHWTRFIVSDLLKGKRDGKYIYARARNWCNKKGLGTSEPSCEIDGSGSSSSRVHVQKDSKVK